MRPDFYVAIMPRWVPYRVAVQRSAGVVEVVLGAGMFLGRTRSWAARGLVWLLVLVFPANIDMAINEVGFRRGEDGRLIRREGAPVGVRNWMRLPFQFVLIGSDDMPDGQYDPDGPVAQWSEQRTHNPSDPGSSPGGPTTVMPVSVPLPSGWAAALVMRFFYPFGRAARRACGSGGELSWLRSGLPDPFQPGSQTGIG